MKHVIFDQVLLEQRYIVLSLLKLCVLVASATYT